MRKYQQLILLILTLVSVSILVIYKKENARLKYVLDVVNFFGKNDADAILKLENSTTLSGAYDLGYPLASWQFLGGDFHTYSAFWKQRSNRDGGEVVAITLGKTKTAVNFKCFVRFGNKGKMKGSFRFERMKEDSTDELSIYKFRCKYESPRKVVAVTFIEVPSRAEHTMLIRDLQPRQATEKIPLAVCLDMTDGFDNFANVTTIQEFFYHYHIIGAEFVVYSEFGLPHFIKTKLLRHGIQPSVFPYNFPFETKFKHRGILEADCILRTSNVAEFVIIVGLSEYLYPYAAKFKPQTEFYSFINQYSQDITSFEIPTRNICISNRNEILSDNNLAEVLPSGSKAYLYRPHFDYYNYKSITIDAKRLALNRYVNCSESANIFDWRNLIDEQSLRYINTISHQLKIYLTQ